MWYQWVTMLIYQTHCRLSTLRPTMSRFWTHALTLLRSHTQMVFFTHTTLSMTPTGIPL
ncbi:hypothetical protein EVA_20297 [gut metagenome]|uniref:Uncharacterized protein n=1 Tax=gut metagenome TaxID=749906 RepID=J9FPW0_9ZZZZ